MGNKGDYYYRQARKGKQSPVLALGIRAKRERQWLSCCGLFLYHPWLALGPEEERESCWLKFEPLSPV